jgi:hypothetical protein
MCHNYFHCLVQLVQVAYLQSLCVYVRIYLSNSLITLHEIGLFRKFQYLLYYAEMIMDLRCCKKCLLMKLSCTRSKFNACYSVHLVLKLIIVSNEMYTFYGLKVFYCLLCMFRAN